MTILLYMNFDELHKLSFRNRGVLSSATQCGCFYCKRSFTPSEITEWTDDGEDTALCPYCSIDSVIPDLDNTLNVELLEAMNRKYF
ncbi:MAG: cytoplasmic protein [Fibrobacter sp.]|nr:cytoplasmic protein [Fibrobacter sp.]